MTLFCGCYLQSDASWQLSHTAEAGSVGLGGGTTGDGLGYG